ncbi:MAG: rRNA maturation RNase YbeY [Alphaproteobacteria bacterium]
MTGRNKVQSPPAEIIAEVSTLCDLWDDITPLLEAIKNALSKAGVFQDFDGKTVEISIVLADDPFVQNLNKTYRDKDKSTNVLSFPQDPTPQDPAPALGDVILAFETVKAEAEEQTKPFNDHLSHLLIHGILHLLGYDHENDADAEEMETLEATLLATLGIKNPYTPIVD